MRQHTNDIFKKNIAARLLKARGEKSQAEFARFLDIPSQQTYQRYEDGLVLPPVDVLHTIASKLSVSLIDLLGSETAGNIPRPLPTEADCVRYLNYFLKTCAGDVERIGWTLTELKEHLPLNKWKPEPPPSSKPPAEREGLLDAGEASHGRRHAKQ